jgi:hypothetical protein
MPSQLQQVQNQTRRPYRILPLERIGYATLASRAGKTLKKATTPLGVVEGTRSSAAERMITYRTGRDSARSRFEVKGSGSIYREGLTVIQEPKDQKGGKET